MPTGEIYVRSEESFLGCNVSHSEAIIPFLPGRLDKAPWLPGRGNIAYYFASCAMESEILEMDGCAFKGPLSWDQQQHQTTSNTSRFI